MLKRILAKILSLFCKNSLTFDKLKHCFLCVRNNGAQNFIKEHIKSIINPRATILAYNPHFCIYKPGAKIVNAKGEDMYGAFTGPLLDEIYVNHYWSKSFEEHKARVAKPRASCLLKKTVVSYSPDFLSKEENHSMDRFIPLLKEKSGIK